MSGCWGAWPAGSTGVHSVRPRGSFDEALADARGRAACYGRPFEVRFHDGSGRVVRVLGVCAPDGRWTPSV